MCECCPRGPPTLALRASSGSSPPTQPSLALRASSGLSPPKRGARRRKRIARRRNAGTHFRTRGSSPRAILPPQPNLRRRFPDSAAFTFLQAQSRSIFASARRYQQLIECWNCPIVVASRTRDEVERIFHLRVCNNRNRRRVSVTGIARLNYWVIARDTCCAAKTPDKLGFRAYSTQPIARAYRTICYL